MISCGSKGKIKLARFCHVAKSCAVMGILVFGLNI